MILICTSLLVNITVHAELLLKFDCTLILYLEIWIQYSGSYRLSTSLFKIRSCMIIRSNPQSEYCWEQYVPSRGVIQEGLEPLYYQHFLGLEILYNSVFLYVTMSVSICLFYVYRSVCHKVKVFWLIDLLNLQLTLLF